MSIDEADELVKRYMQLCRVTPAHLATLEAVKWYQQECRDVERKILTNLDDLRKFYRISIGFTIDSY